MIRRVLICLITVLLAASLCGCWNYRGLDQMDIVVGIAIDFDKQTNLYNICYEIADITGAEKDRNTTGKLVESKGKTLFDAARNAKTTEPDKLFFGSAYIVVISREVASDIGLSRILEWFIRDGECRETMYVAVSQEDTAKAILENGQTESGIISVTLQDIIMEDSQVTGSSMNLELFEIYNMIESPRKSTMLAVLKNIQSHDKKLCELNGIAVFKGDKLQGFLGAEESKYALMVEDKLKGGILTLKIAGKQTDDISLEIFSNKTNLSYKYEKGRVKVFIEVDTDVAIGENQMELDTMDEYVIKIIKNMAQEMIEKDIMNLIDKVQNEFKADIFGFGEMIYKHNLPLWKQLKPNWEDIFPTVEVEASSIVHIKYSGFLR